MSKKPVSAEEKRLKEKTAEYVPVWQKWGPYVSERSWGTVREDYSADGNAWQYFPFEQSTRKAYRWGEDGIAGWCDRYQTLAFSPAFWNGKDPILKERLFGVDSTEGNHGEDVKEIYFHLDGTPTHSYMKYLYKYPQEEFPYERLKEENRKRGGSDSEYELIDTGVFHKSRYFDVFIEYAKKSPEEVCIKIEVHNRGDLSAPFHLLAQLWFRNQWSWGNDPLPSPEITEGKGACLVADEGKMLPPANLGFEYRLGKRYLYGPKGGETLFTDNETRFPGEEKTGRYYKDGFHRTVVQKEKGVSPMKKGSKAALYYQVEIAPGASHVFHFRLTDSPQVNPIKGVDEVVALRKKEADDFYENIHPARATDEEKRIQRQAFAGILWSKQIYLFDVALWLKGDNTTSLPPSSRYGIRNVHWRHLNSMRILMMPDKWEYPWFASWDQAFH